MSEEFFDYENQEPKNPLIAFLLITSCIFVVAIIAFFSWMFIVTRDNENNRKINASKYLDVQNMRKTEDAKLNGYQYIDQDKGTVRIPVERAMQLIVEEAKSGAPKAETAPAASPAPAPAKPADANPAAAKPAVPAKAAAAATAGGQKK